ncbi:hypothetical protein NO995_11525 [Aestuariibaculum sp. M13]|uniref:hypothetical protein n=1 Tax=Aestuariibaculum sp. M13 TaxID=2967132 RepID=UPI002159D2FC|nr:hypothetical protein [Aestuariibaculum sp. M13]MCR8668314.1 hypothetical protein [Aestuariibaculum sp. M13]
MRRLTTLVIIVLFQSLLSIAQEDKAPVFSVSVGGGFYSYFSSDTHYSGEDHSKKQSVFNINGDIALWLDRYIFSFYFSSGLGDVATDNKVNYSEYNITVGMEFISKDWFALEGHFGMGYFQTKQEYYYLDGEIDQQNTLGFPFRIKANAYLSKHFAIGINPNVNINFDADYSIVAINLITQYRF